MGLWSQSASLGSNQQWDEWRRAAKCAVQNRSLLYSIKIRLKKNPRPSKFEVVLFMHQSSFPLLQSNACLFPRNRTWPCLLFQHIVMFLKNSEGKKTSCWMALSFSSLCQNFYLTGNSSVGLLCSLTISTSYKETLDRCICLKFVFFMLHP